MKLKKVIIVYEGIAREYDNALLLKNELERRGYKLRLVYKCENIFLRNPKAIVIVPNCYTSENYDFYRYSLNANFCPIISLQYEQVLSKRIEKIGFHIPKGKARNVYLFCWGMNCCNRLLAQGIERSRIKICGAVQLDFFRDEFRGFYLDRNAIAKKYNIIADKKWVLYISSFSYVDNKVITQYLADDFNDAEFVEDFTALSVESQKITLEWFEQLIIDDPDVCIIYRKHPNESENKRIQKLSLKYPDNFKDISELSVKQWIVVSDIVTTWFSTSIAEVYTAHRPLLLIRPIPIKEEYDVPFYYNANCIDSYGVLQDAMNDIEKFKMPVSESLLNEYYSIEDKPAYIRVADAVDEVNSIYKPAEFAEKGFIFKRLIFIVSGGRIIKLCLKKIYQFLFIHMGVSIKNEKIRKMYSISDWEAGAKNYNDALNKEKDEYFKGIVNEQ